MKTYISWAMLLCAGIPSYAQVYNDGAMTNPGGLISDFSSQYINTATGTYSTASSTGGPSNYGVFEHRGQSSTGTAAAMVNNGSYDASIFGRDYFMGPDGVAGQQEISGSVMPTFGELYIQNGAASQFNITNTNGIRVVTNTTFANGITTTVRSNHSNGALKFADNATYTGGNTNTQHVNGYVSKEGDDLFTFPVGDGSQLRTLSFTTAPASGSNASVAWFTGDPGTVTDPSDNAVHSTSAMAAPIMSVSEAGYWDWVPVTGTFTNNISVSIPDLSGTGVSPSNLRLVGWNGTQWIALGTSGASGNTAGSTLGGTMQSGITAIGIGSIGIELPVLFSSFDVVKEGCKARLNWSTAMEHNNNHFEIDRSSDGRNFSMIGKVQAKGNSSEVQHYSYVNLQSRPGTNYYRITQVDVDGKRSRTAVKSIDFDDCGSSEIKVYPTVTNGTLFVELPVGYEDADISVYTTLGQLLKLPNTGKVSRTGLHSIEFSGLAQGQYILRVENGNEVHTFRAIYKF